MAKLGTAVRRSMTALAVLAPLLGIAAVAPSTQLTTTAAVVSAVNQPQQATPTKATPKHGTAKAPHKVSRRVRHVTARLDVTPVMNIAPQPNFVSDCPAPSMTAACVAEAVSAISNARGVAGLPPMRFNTAAFLALTPSEQLFVITNLERTARGLLPAAALTAQLDAVATSGATADADPSLKGWSLTGGRSAVEWSSNWAGDLGPFGADYYWVYADGTGVNVDCPTAGAAGCWEHRQNVLMGPPSASMCAGIGQPSELMGVAYEPGGYQNTPSIAELYVGTCGALPTDVVFTWARAKHLLGIS